MFFSFYKRAHALWLRHNAGSQGGYPPLDPPFLGLSEGWAMKRNRVLRVRLSDDEYAYLYNLSHEYGVDMSKLVRDAVVLLPRKTKRVVFDDRFYRELSKIGNNVNQIARVVNVHKSDVDAFALLLSLRKIYSLLTRLVGTVENVT